MANDDCRAENSEIIRGVEVKFPYKPYPLQKAYMNQVLTCVTDSKNGLLESPTGTGKTLSLLCSSLAWLKTKREIEKKKENELKESNTGINLEEESKNTKSPKLFRRKEMFIASGWKQKGTRIVYSSRTHVQLSQAIGEMKKTNYSSMNAVVLGSRDQYCLNSEVMRLDNISVKNHSCLVKTNCNACPYYSQVETLFKKPDYTVTPIHDIEDLVSLGKKHTLCPYYASKTLAQRADVVFVPYNYLIDKKIRKSQKFDLKNAVVIFDEGHNIEKCLEEAASTELSSQSLAICKENLDMLIMELCEKEQTKEHSVQKNPMYTLTHLELGKVINLKEKLCDMEEELCKAMSVEQKIVFLPDDGLYQILEKSNFDCSLLKVIYDVIRYLIENLVATPRLSIAITALEKLQNFMNNVYPDCDIQKSDFVKNFNVFVVKDEITKSMNTKYSIESVKKSDMRQSWTLNVFCLTPKVAMQSLLNCGVRSCIITSGTLAPLSSFEAELGVPFTVRLQSSHIVDSKNLKVFTIGQGKDGEQLNSSFKNRDNIKYYHSLGVSVAEFIKYIPGGVFLFFSSYRVMNSSVSYWKESGSIWQSISSAKQVFLETEDKTSFDENFQKYKQKVDEEGSNGAVFFGVCRGKLAERLDANDQYCRGVFIAGLPYPPIYDLRVIFKMQYLNENKEVKISPWDWYQLQMTRAVNQAVGRIIRHKDDYGVVLLLDNRFAVRKYFSTWIQPLICTNPFEESLKTAKDFFSERLQMMPKVEPESEKIFSRKPLDSQAPSTSTLLNQYTERSSMKKVHFEPQRSNSDALYSAARNESNVTTNTVDVKTRPAYELNSTDSLPVSKKRRLNVPLVSLQSEIETV